MFDSEALPDGGGDGDRIVLAQVNQAYWMLEGEQHLDALLLGREPIPKPVRCVRFRSTFDLSRFLPQGRDLTSLWGINPAIISRLRQSNELVFIEMPEDG